MLKLLTPILLLLNWIKYKPNTPIEEGVKNFVDWYIDFYRLND